MRQRLEDSRSVEDSQAELRGQELVEDEGTAFQGFATALTSLLSARNKCLTTIELLEETLLHLPLREIIQAKRVSKNFKDTIDGSIKIQRAIFFTPTTESIPPPLRRLIGNMRAPNLPSVSARNRGHKHDMIITMAFESTPGLIRSTTRQVLTKALEAGEAWRHHMVSVPPCTHIRYVGAIDEIVYTVSNSKGATVGDMVDAVKLHMPALDRTRMLGPMKGGKDPAQLPKSITGWEVTVLLLQILDEMY